LIRGRYCRRWLWNEGQCLCVHSAELLRATPRVNSVWRMAFALLVVSGVSNDVHRGHALNFAGRLILEDRIACGFFPQSVRPGGAKDNRAEVAAREVLRILQGQHVGLDVAESRLRLLNNAVGEVSDNVLFEVALAWVMGADMVTLLTRELELLRTVRVGVG
jgi:hypothetical protein